MQKAPRWCFLLYMRGTLPFFGLAFVPFSFLNGCIITSFTLGWSRGGRTTRVCSRAYFSLSRIRIFLFLIICVDKRPKKVHCCADGILEGLLREIKKRPGRSVRVAL